MSPLWLKKISASSCNQTRNCLISKPAISPMSYLCSSCVYTKIAWFKFTIQFFMLDSSLPYSFSCLIQVYHTVFHAWFKFTIQFFMLDSNLPYSFSCLIQVYHTVFNSMKNCMVNLNQAILVLHRYARPTGKTTVTCIHPVIFLTCVGSRGLLLQALLSFPKPYNN